MLVAGEPYQPVQLDAAPDGNGVPPKVSPLDRARARVSRFYFGEQIPKLMAAELADAHHGPGRHATPELDESHTGDGQASRELEGSATPVDDDECFALSERAAVLPRRPVRRSSRCSRCRGSSGRVEPTYRTTSPIRDME